MQIRESTNKIRRKDIIYPELSYKVSGLLYEVHNELGKYCKEKQYGDLFEKLLMRDNIKFSRELLAPFETSVGDIGKNFLDFVIENKIVVELKAKKMILKQDFYQVKRYLEALNLPLGIVANFRDEYLSPKRVLNRFSANS